MKINNEYIYLLRSIWQKKMSEVNPILSYVGEIPIRKRNYVRLELNDNEYTKLAEIALKTNLSIAAIIAYLAQPCSCGISSITITIPKGLLSTKKNKSGRSILNRIEHGNKE